MRVLKIWILTSVCLWAALAGLVYQLEWIGVWYEWASSFAPDPFWLMATGVAYPCLCLVTFVIWLMYTLWMAITREWYWSPTVVMLLVAGLAFWPAMLALTVVLACVFGLASLNK